ncbi:SGNH/GDSL hydrolase family protein [Pseudonocardia sp. GCM10023141]|uniref:SGNH/GDSL hydrolase family protein n=1 Tax=Pseudonocardia sp. GCM10023141 TaxID=3252653 RepID=UPI00361AC431
MTLDHSNLSGRPPGRFVALASRLLPGVREVQEQIEPYALAWQRHNREALAGTGPLWVALGDSMTIGVGASAYDRGWVGLLAARKPGWRVVNLAISGGRVRDVPPTTSTPTRPGTRAWPTSSGPPSGDRLVRSGVEPDRCRERDRCGRSGP